MIVLTVLGMIVLLVVFAAVMAKAGATQECVALIRIEGPIYESKNALDSIRRAREAKQVKAIVVRVDSPGGAVGASEEIYRELVRTRAEKPVVISMGNVAASGGYYISTGANEIFANAGTITGSIGVIATDFDIEQLLQSLRIRPNVIKSGEHKDTGSPLRPMTEEEKNLLQRLVYDLHRQFVREVIRSRRTAIEKALRDHPQAYSDILATTETKKREKAIELAAFDAEAMAQELSVDVAIVNRVRAMADGRVFTGEQALALGLIDSIGNLEDARRRATILANLPAKAPFVDFTTKKTFLDMVEKFATESSGAFFQQFSTVKLPALR
ncbi:MAG: signal peptide peptidase SppA [Candidatus Sumerlaeaceae bacterium]